MDSRPGIGRPVIFAPDYRGANPYQQLLAGALAARGVEIGFLSDYRRLLPLWRGSRSFPRAILHLHWPEAYFAGAPEWRAWVRKIRFPLDLLLARSGHPLIVTAHNLKPHWTEAQVHPLFAYTFRIASRVIAHSSAAKELLVREARLRSDRIAVIPHGDLLDSLPPLTSRGEARAALRLDPVEKYALGFGRLAPYKGLEELIVFWGKAKPPVTLAIAGEPGEPGYGDLLARLVDSAGAKILFRSAKLTDQEVSWWLSAADCTIFNYLTLFTSGAAALARSVGIPILFPTRLTSVDLGEPCSTVFRFDQLNDYFLSVLLKAISIPKSDVETELWRQTTSWKNVALQTLEVYRQAISPLPRPESG